MGNSAIARRRAPEESRVAARRTARHASRSVGDDVAASDARRNAPSPSSPRLSTLPAASENRRPAAEEEPAADAAAASAAEAAFESTPGSSR